MKSHHILFAVCILSSGPLTAAAGWELYEETNVKGSVRGTIKKGHIIPMRSGSVYEVSEVTLQLVLEPSPKATILREGDKFKLAIDGFDEPLICNQISKPKMGGPASAPAVDPSTPLEEFMSVEQQREMGIHKLTSEEREKLRKYLLQLYSYGLTNRLGEPPAERPSRVRAEPPAERPSRVRAEPAVERQPQVQVADTPSAVESQIDGQFEGWTGETIVKLMNGQIWQQVDYYYRYHYAYMPKVIVYRSAGGHKMKVEGIDKAVGVQRIK